MNIQEKWKEYLDLYGADFDRWPVTLSNEDKKLVISWPEYQVQGVVDSALSTMQWPEPSSEVFMNVMEHAHTYDRRVQFMPDFVFSDLRPGILAACFVLFLGLGLTFGTQYQSAQAQSSYDGYFSYDVSSTYTTNFIGE